MIDINISTLNVNSLNFSTRKAGNENCPFKTKLASILSSGDDIYLLQDVRLNNNYKIFDRYINFTNLGNFSAICNSEHSSRGVALVYKTELDIEVIDIIKDKQGNFLFVIAKIDVRYC